MLGLIRYFFDRRMRPLRHSIAAVYALLLVINVVVWAWAFLTFRQQPVLLGTGLLAYSFGLRHAVDADHIAAIDNVTRKLMQEGKRPVTVGFFFAMGHATVVILAAAGIALTATALHFDQAKSMGGIISTSVSALFLFAIAVMNLLIFLSVWKTYRRGRLQPAAEQAWVCGAVVSAPIRAHPQELAHVPARLPVRTRL
jgi:high-affinity nickel-transport protein